jgi:hypothetical protein
MKALPLALAFLVLISALPLNLASQEVAASKKNKTEDPPPTYLSDRYGNNPGPGGVADQVVRLINIGRHVKPSLGPPPSDVCASIYVFDNNQVMVACCSCRIPPNQLASASVGNQLTANPLTSLVPTAGVVSIVPVAAGKTTCDPTAPITSSDASLLQGFATHVEVTGGLTYITETAIAVAALGTDEASFLTNACMFVQYLGSGRGICDCSTPGF